MIVLGGVTRLTQSGLSIVDWDPVMGTLPPLTQDAWEEAFGEYKAFPEYEAENSDMTLGEFKGIFWVEWAHRLVGRVIGLALILPTIWFALRRRIDRPLFVRLLVIFGLVALEGVLGWVMVASGLVDMPRVSPVRLSAHLVLATVIFGAVLWTALDVLDRSPPDTPAPAAGRKAGWALLGFVLLTMVSGGFVAGTRAGFAYNTFPLMGGRLVPEGLLEETPVWANFLDNMATVQFQHRVLALLLFGCVVAYGAYLLSHSARGRLRAAAWALIGLAVLQVGLGISTLLLAVPVALGTAHQAVAVALFGLTLFTVHESGTDANVRVVHDHIHVRDTDLHGSEHAAADGSPGRG
ncbi:MAG: COX15/CtaA family protein [Acidimicrobiia bacterium]|nr:COX15/CtaA family protein [Acidimicrobiia bacterium]